MYSLKSAQPVSSRLKADADERHAAPESVMFLRKGEGITPRRLQFRGNNIGDSVVNDVNSHSSHGTTAIHVVQQSEASDS